MSFILILFTALAGSVHAYNEKYVYETCLRLYRGDCKLVTAIAYHESKYKPDAFNEEGSYGIMQIKCTTARSIGFKGKCDDLFKPEDNIRLAIKYIETKKARYKKYTDIIASYNSGTPIICKNYNEGKCYPSQYYNQAYVDKVIRKYIDLIVNINPNLDILALH